MKNIKAIYMVAVLAASALLLSIATIQAQAGVLHEAAYAGDIAKVRQLLEQGTGINERNENQDTPLHKAVGFGKTDVVKLLIEKGADVNARNSRQDTPLHKAVGFGIGNTDVVKLLIEKGADVNARNSDQSTPLHEAAGIGRTEVAKLLIEKGADVNARNLFTDTPLHQAVRCGFGKTDLVKLLIEKGADVNAVDYEQKTPAMIAEKLNRLELAAMLRQAGDVKREVPDGFLGIPWGASKDQIIKTMNERAYQQLTGTGPGDLAFRGAFAGNPCQLIFSLIAGSLVSGAAEHCAIGTGRGWPQEYFKRVVKMLSEKYGPPQNYEYPPVSAEKQKNLEAGGAGITYAAANWDFIDSRTTDKYGIRVYLFRVWSPDGTLNYYVDIYYRANSLRERLEKKDY